ncbi:MAG: GDP-L-fucose synthase [Gammaproteobacteria bacterium]|nr:GDP-L-fucose synthase [Gammaproteobacteria bacterium]
MSEKSTLKILVLGGTGMVGSAIIRTLRQNGYINLLTPTREHLNLTDQLSVRQFFEVNRPHQVYMAAAKVGGIHANSSFPADFILQNLTLQTNVIDACFLSGVKRVLFLGSSCIYPKFSPQPITEEALLSGQLELTNEAYAVAKIAGIKLCENFNRQYGASKGIDYRSIMPCNLYGPGDNYHELNSHVIPALLRRVHQAKMRGSSSVTVWGTGSPRREFLFVDDVARAAVFVMGAAKDLYSSVTGPLVSHLNVGSGSDLTVAELAQTIKSVVGFKGEIIYDSTKPDGTQMKLLDNRRIAALGWSPVVTLHEGLVRAYDDFRGRVERLEIKL